jgi:superfamily II DNA or RNA helicase
MTAPSSSAARLAALAAELRELEDRRSRLLAEQAELLRRDSARLALFTPSAALPGTPSPGSASPTSAASRFTPYQKIALFLRLFACRTDVYPRRWENTKTGRSGYSPACRNEWVRGVCEKPRVKCTDCPHRSFPPLDADAVRDHLTGRHTLGAYAIRADDTCTFLAADFDGPGWRDDLTAYRRAAANLGLAVAAERSRSGNGGHAWLFFAEPVPAALARRLGTFLLAHATVLHPTLRLGAYDRFFPNQDTLPSGGFGNLIALPLQKPARDQGNSVFLDDTLAPVPDQWAHLAALPRLTREDLDSALARAAPPAFHATTTSPRTTPEDPEPFQLQSDESALDLLPASITRDLHPHPVAALRAAQLVIPLAATPPIPARLIAALRRLATFANPVFHEKQRLRFPTFDTPRFLFAGEAHPDRLVLPRGVIAEAAQLIRRAGGRLILDDQRPPATTFSATFRGDLTAPQQAAVHALLGHDEGVLVAPPGAGKTVMACALIARRGVRTLVLVHRASLLEQWRERLAAFLGLAPRSIHRLGGAKRTAAAPVALGMLQTLARSAHPEALLAPYAHVIIDECHHVPAAGFEAALKACPARFILGLTATPRRKDGLQKLLHLQCGPVRHHFAPALASHASVLPRRLVLRTCAPDLPPPEAPIHQLWTALVTSRARNEQIAADIAACLREGRAIAVLSERRQHLENLQAHTASLLAEPAPALHRIDGSTTRRDRGAILADLARLSDSPSPAPFALFATASLLGEGFDLPRLDTLFLTTPVSFSGRVVQYAGRLHRAHPAKTEVRIYDYHEPAHRLSAHMHRKRAATLHTLGYRETTAPTADPHPSLPLV